MTCQTAKWKLRVMSRWYALTLWCHSWESLKGVNNFGSWSTVYFAFVVKLVSFFFLILPLSIFTKNCCLFFFFGFETWLFPCGLGKSVCFNSMPTFSAKATTWTTQVKQYLVEQKRSFRMTEIHKWKLKFHRYWKCNKVLYYNLLGFIMVEINICDSLNQSTSDAA